MRALPVAILAVVLLAPSPFASGQELEAIARSGLPALSRNWSGPEYAQAADVIAKGRVPLPRLSDPEGAAILARLLSTENLSLCRNAALPLKMRLPDFAKIIGSTGQIIMVYLKAAGDKQSAPHEELARLMAFMLQVSAQGGELADELLLEIPEDETYATRMNGLKQMRSGLTSVFIGAETSLGETGTYVAADLSIILEAMAATLPQLKKAFAKDVVIELRRKLERDRQRFTGADGLRLDAMIRELAVQEPLAPAGTPPAVPKADPTPGAAPARG